MFNETELFYIRIGRNDRWGRPCGRGFTFPEPERKPIIIRRSLISDENRAVCERVQERIKKMLEI